MLLFTRWTCYVWAWLDWGLNWEPSNHLYTSSNNLWVVLESSIMTVMTPNCIILHSLWLQVFGSSSPLYFFSPFILLSLTLCVCVCVWERERERERESVSLCSVNSVVESASQYSWSNNPRQKGILSDLQWESEYVYVCVCSHARTCLCVCVLYLCVCVCVHSCVQESRSDHALMSELWQGRQD